MALVKKSALNRRGGGKALSAATTTDTSASTVPAPANKLAPRRRSPRSEETTALQKLDQATQELASGLGESAASAAELQRTVEEMSSSAEEAAGAAQESLGLIGHLRGNFREADSRATASLAQTEQLQGTFAGAAGEIETSVSAITLAAKRQLGSIAIIEQLEAAATRIGAVGDTVSDLAEQTGMLALNAAIEATRAGESGRGFAIVADEVREIAEGAEGSAGEIRALAARIIDEVKTITTRIQAASELATREAGKGIGIAAALTSARNDLGIVVDGAVEIAAAAAQAEIAATEAERGAEQVASAAEEQSSAAAQAQQALEQQSASLEESQQAAEALGELSAALGEDADALTLEQIAAAAEELSATVQELSGASSEIQIAVEQIARGAQLQSAATLQSSAAMAQIEASADVAQIRAAAALDKLEAIVAVVAEGTDDLASLVTGVEKSVVETRAVLDLLAGLSDTARKAEKIADALALGALQTNMLGVSGAVEATRAGEAGHGFATVTGDIRKLARGLAANAEDGKDVVRAIQDQIAVMRRDLDQIAGAGEAEAGRNQALINRFATMSGELDATRAVNRKILDGAEAIQRSAREVRSGSDQIAKAAEIASEATREAGSAAQQQALGAESLAAAIEDIASLAASLAPASEPRGT